MAIALVSQVTANGSGTFTTGSIDTTGATLLVAAASHYNTLGPAVITDSNGNTWTGLTLRTHVNKVIRIFYVQNPTVGTGHTFSQTDSDAFGTLTVSAWSGAATSGVFDTEQGGYTSADNQRVGTSDLVPSEDNSLLLVAWADDANGTLSIAGANGWTYLGGTPYASGTSIGSHIAYLIQTTKATVSSSTNVVTYATVVSQSVGASAVFKSSGGGGGGGGSIAAISNRYARSRRA